MAKQSTIKLKDITPDDKNFNKGTEFGHSLIEKSFAKTGAGRSILLDKNNRIIAGNKSTEVYAASGGEDILVVESDGTKLIAVKRTDIDLDTPRGREMALADNATAKANIIFDAELIVAELGEAVCVEYGVDVPKEAQDDIFSGKAPVSPISNKGDFYEIGKHRLFCGDSRKRESYKKLFGDHLADLVLTDPPYNVDYVGKTKEALKIKNDKMAAEAFYNFLLAFYILMVEHTKNGGAWYVWHADTETVAFRNALAEAGIKTRQNLIWKKQQFVMGRQDYHWQHEPCLYGWKDGGAHHFYASRTQSTVMEFDRPRSSETHPTMKPVPLFAYQITNSSKQGDIVADCFGGSGTTMVASDQLGRTCFMMEDDPKYCDVIVARMILANPALVIKRNGKVLKEKDLQQISDNVNG